MQREIMMLVNSSIAQSEGDRPTGHYWTTCMTMSSNLIGQPFSSPFLLIHIQIFVFPFCIWDKHDEL